MKLFFRKYGDGPPLLILHGLFGSSDNWVTIARQLSASCTVILPDLRNHGVSPHDDVHDYPAMCNDLHELVTSLGLTRFSVLGHSMGGKVAMLFASEYPSMIENLMVADISPFTGERRKAAGRFENLAILKAMKNSDLSAAKSRIEIENNLREYIQSEKIIALIMKNLQRRPDNSFEWKVNVEALANNLESILDAVPFRADRIPVTGFPVIFLKGEKSDYFRDGEIVDIRSIFPAAEIRIVEDAGHWIQADNQEEVTKAILEMMGR
jgi:pimeloyl-ACP methyl ester carboxylesterase